MFMTIVSVAFHLMVILPESMCTRNDGKGKDCVLDLGIELCSLQSVAII
jgi:hypothetical protein